jgi:hypothetical protein
MRNLARGAVSMGGLAGSERVSGTLFLPFGKAGCATYPPVDADLEFAVVMHSTSSLLSPHAGCHHLSELLSNQKRLPLAEVAGYAERS